MNLREQLENMSPREQKLLGILGIIAGALIFLGIPIYVWSSVSSAREHNEEIRAVLTRMNKASELLALRKSERQQLEQRYAKPAPALASFIESAAKANGLDVPESTDQPEKKDKGYIERSTVVKMRKVGLRPLVKMLEKIESSGYPVAITQLNIKAKATGPDLYDVKLGVSAFEKTSAPKPSKKSPAKGGKSPKAAKDDEEKEL